jgi:hypothetical protein
MAGHDPDHHYNKEQTTVSVQARGLSIASRHSLHQIPLTSLVPARKLD